MRGKVINLWANVFYSWNFEDLPFFDDIPSRPTFRKGKETPYFGSRVPAPEDMSLPHPHLAFPPSGTGAALLLGVWKMILNTMAMF